MHISTKSVKNVRGLHGFHKTLSPKPPTRVLQCVFGVVKIHEDHRRDLNCKLKFIVPIELHQYFELESLNYCKDIFTNVNTYTRFDVLL